MGKVTSVFDLVADGIKAGREKIRAFHGSPHDMPAVDMVVHKETGKSYYIETDQFGSYKNHPVIKKNPDQYEFVDHFPQGHFDSSKIGTGEGAQAYGRGLYFAEREGTGITYRDQLTPRDMEYEDWLMSNYKEAEAAQDYGRMEMYERAMQHDRPQDFRDIANDTDYDEDYRALANEIADEIDNYTKADGTKPNFGHMYEVDIDASPDELLDYDLPLKEQSPQVQKAIDDLMVLDGVESYSPDGVKVYLNTGVTGDTLGHEILQHFTGKNGREGASKTLDFAGIKGIKYADAQTRFSPKGKTHNYVVFDDKLIQIARKYGVMMPVAGAILAGTMTPEQAQAGVVTKAARESMLKFFDQAEVDNAIRQAGSRKSREALTQMPIDDFLALAREGYSPAKAAGISDVSKFDDLPFLNIRSEDGIANITGHEGRHRARRLKELGESTVPVRIKSDIRWDQQDDPTLWDYEQDYPQILFNEDGTKKSPFPFVQGDSNLMDSSALNIEDIPRKTTPTSTSKQINDDELLKSLFGGSAATAVGGGALFAPKDLQAAEYNEAPVIEEQSFGDMVNEYGQINRNLKALDDQRFARAVAEREARRGMSRRERRDNPPSEALRELAMQDMKPSLGSVAQGIVEGNAQGLDYFHPLNLGRMILNPANEGLGRFIAPSIVSTYENAVSPVAKPVLFDERDPKADEKSRSGKNFGNFFSLF